MPAQALLDRLERVRRSGKGWSARCPAHEDRGPSLAIAEGKDGHVLIHCFAGCTADDVLVAVGLSFADVMPDRLTEDTPEQRRELRDAARMANWAAALGVLEYEGRLALIAACKTKRGESLSDDDMRRLTVAIDRIESARLVLRPNR